MIRVHTLVALGFLGTFIVTGVYMKFLLPSAYAEDVTVRMLFRSSHIYLLFAALINGLLAIHLGPPPKGRARLRGTGSVLIAVTPALFTASFFLESPIGSINRPLIFVGVLLVALGAVLHLVAHRRPRGMGGPS